MLVVFFCIVKEDCGININNVSWWSLEMSIATHELLTASLHQAVTLISQGSL